MADMSVQDPEESARRLVAADGRFNFRDMGGYPTDDGRVVRWGRAYRSGMMVHLTAAGHASLAGLGIRAICDFRTTTERNDAPTSWQAMGASDYWCRDYTDSGGDIRRLLLRGADHTAEEARAAMIGNYRTLAFEQADAYRELFRRIAENHLPVIFNCSAGKDRTGVAAALLLTLLGVPRATVTHDYLLTNEVMARDAALLIGRGLLKTWRGDAAVAPLVRAETDYLSAMFEAVETECGSVDNFLVRELGIDRERRDAIKHAMLEPV